MSDRDIRGAVEPVVGAVRQAAREPLEAGAAELTISSVKEVYGQSAEYDAPAIVLAPRERAAARVVVEVHGHDLWWLSAGDGPGFEFYVGMREDRYALLKRLVRAVVRGDYEHLWEERSQRLLLMPWRHRTRPVWVAAFGRGRDVIATEHYTDPRGKDPAHRRFAPYLRD
jgi:hypothetical protein